MEFHSFSHHNRYAPHRPHLPNLSGDRSPYPHHLQPPPPPAIHPPPSYPPLQPVPPPPPPYNPQQSQFTFLHHHRPIEDDTRKPRFFGLTHHHHIHHQSPPPRVSDRTLFKDGHLPRLRIPEFDHRYPDPRSDSSEDPLRVPPQHRPTRPVALGFDHEPPLHHRPFIDHQRAISPYRPTESYNLDFGHSTRLRDEFIDGYRNNNKNQQLLWSRKDPHGDEDDDDIDNYHQRHGLGLGGDHYISNSDRSSRSFEFGGDSHNISNSNLSRDFVTDFVTNVRNYESSYSSLSEIERSWNNRDEDLRLGHALQPSREVLDAPKGMETNEFVNGDGVPFVSARQVVHSYDSFKFNNRGREGREESVHTPKKQIQKKSVLLRIGKPNNRNRSHDHNFSKAYFDDSNTSSLRGKDKDSLMYSDHRMEEESEGSPVELDVSFKSNALVAKAIVAPSISAVVSDTNLTPRNRKIRKVTVSDSPLTKFSEPSVKSDNSTHGPDCPSSSDKATKQLTEKVTVSGNLSACDIGSLPCSSGTNDSSVSNAVRGSPKGTVSNQGDNSDGSDGKPSCRVRKRKKVTAVTSHASSLQSTKKDGEPVNADSSTNSPSAPDQGVVHSKEKITSAGMVLVRDVVSLPSANELSFNKVDESPRAIVFEKDDAYIDSGRTSIPDTQRNSSTHLLDSSSPLENKIDVRTENADKSVHVCEFVLNSDKVQTELQNGSTVSNIHWVDDVSEQPCQNGVPILPSVDDVSEQPCQNGFPILHRVDDVSKQPCQNGVLLLQENGIVRGSSEGIVSIGGNGNAGLSSPEEIEIYEGDSKASVHVACNALSFDFGIIKRQETITGSGIDAMDVGPKQSSLNEITGPLENDIMEGSINVVPLVGGYSILGLSNAVETKIHEVTANLDSSNHDSSTTSSSNNDLTDFWENKIVSNTCVVADTSKQSCLDGANILLKNGPVEGSSKAKVLVADNPNVCSGKDYTTKVKRKREVRNIQLCLSSPRTSDKPLNVVSSDTTLSCSLKDLVSSEEEHSSSSAGSFHVGSQSGKDGDRVLHGNGLNEGSSVVELLVRGGVDGGPNDTSPKYRKKKKIFVPHEKPVSEGGAVLIPPNTSLDNSRISMKAGHPVVSDLSINTKTASFLTQDTSKKTTNLNSVSRKLNLRRNQPSSAVPRVVAGHSSLVFSRKTAPTKHNANPRTWHRTSNPSASPLAAKKSSSNPVPPQRLLPKKVGQVQSSYIRKGNSLVRRHVPFANLPHGSHASSSTVYRLNPPGIDGINKNSGSESRVDVIDPASCLRTGGLNAPFERPRTPPRPRSTKLLNCTTIHSGDVISLPIANPRPSDCSVTTSDPLELTENVDAPKLSEDALKSSGTPEYQIGLINSLETQRILDEGSGKKIIYVKRKSNQLIAASNSSDLSVPDVTKAQALSSDGYYKRRKNQLIRSPLERDIMQRVVIHDETLNLVGQRVPKVISSRSSTRRQFGKGLIKINKPTKFSSVWTLCNTESSKKYANSLRRQKVWPYLFPWKRATYWRSFLNNSVSVSNNNSLSIISRKLLLSRKRETIYTRSTHGYSLHMSKLLSVGGSSLKWSKSIERNSRRANEEATLAVAAVEKKKREKNGAACLVAGTKRKRIFRIGSVRYKMDPTRRTLQRISSDEEEPSCSASLHSEKDVKKPYIPRRLLIGNDEYVRLGNGNQLIRDPKKRTRILASEKVRWSLHTARLRLARKRKYCQFFTRFGKCNKDDGKCPYIHDASKIAVCTKFLNGSCSNPNCKLTHKVIPERMQDCSYFLQGLCSNESCPYRHVNVTPSASICEGFLKGYCSDGNECRKKHTYVCPIFEATGICPLGSKCKLHHPKNRSKGMKRKPSREQKNARGRYFGARNTDIGSRNIDIAECGMAVSENHSSKDDDYIFCQEGKFSDYVSLDVSNEEAEETNNLTSELRAVCDDYTSDLQEADLDELTKPIGIMNKKLIMESVSGFDSISEKTVSYVSEESNCCK